MKREVAVVPVDNSNETKWYTAMYRDKGLLFWNKWKVILSTDKSEAFSYSRARYFADQALSNGVVPAEYPHVRGCYPIVELDEDQGE